MSNTNRDYAIVYDVKNGSLVSSRPLIFYITDKNTSNIFVKLVTRVSIGDGVDQYTDLEPASNFVLTMRVIKPNNEVKNLEATQLESESIFQFDLTEDFKDIPGEYICELIVSTIVSLRQELTTSEPFKYEVKRSILSNVGEIIETEDTTVEKLLNDLNAIKIELSSHIKDITNKSDIYLQDFGVVGDGVTDDTQSLQSAINYCVANNKVLKSKTIKILVSSTININGKLNADFGHSTITTNTNLKDLIVVSALAPAETGTIKNLILDGNNKVNTVLNHRIGLKGSYEDVQIYNGLVRGLYVYSSHETFFTNIRFENCLLGIECESTDVHFFNIALRFCHTSIKNTGASNNYTNVHGWINSDFEGSVFADVHKPCFFTDCYPDTYQIAYKINGYVSVTINGGRGIYNKALWNENMAGKPAYVFYYDEATHSNSTYACNLYFNGVPNNENFKFSNIPSNELKLNATKLGKFFNFNDVPTGITATYTLNTNWSTEVANIIKKDRRVNVELVANYQYSITANTFYSILKFTDLDFVPTKSYFGMCIVKDQEGNIVTYGEVQVSYDKSIKIRVKDTTTNGRYIINMSYDV